MPHTIRIEYYSYMQTGIQVFPLYRRVMKWRMTAENTIEVPDYIRIADRIGYESGK